MQNVFELRVGKFNFKVVYTRYGVGFVPDTAPDAPSIAELAPPYVMQRFLQDPRPVLYGAIHAGVITLEQLKELPIPERAVYALQNHYRSDTVTLPSSVVQIEHIPYSYIANLCVVGHDGAKQELYPVIKRTANALRRKWCKVIFSGNAQVFGKSEIVVKIASMYEERWLVRMTKSLPFYVYFSRWRDNFTVKKVQLPETSSDYLKTIVSYLYGDLLLVPEGMHEKFKPADWETARLLRGSGYTLALEDNWPIIRPDNLDEPAVVDTGQGKLNISPNNKIYVCIAPFV